MTTEKTVVKTIANLYANGTETRDELILGVFQAHADIGLNKATKFVAEWMKAEGLTTSKAGINAEFDAFLIEGCEAGEPRNAAAISAWIAENGTANTERHKAHYQRLGRLAEAAYNKGKS